MKPITQKQQIILDYIKKCIAETGYPPTVREICEAVNLKSTSSVHSHLSSLEKNGYIRRDPTKPRCIEIVDELEIESGVSRKSLINIPVVKNLSVDITTLLSSNNAESYFPIMPEYVRDRQVFMYKINSENMTSKGIFSGDMVLFEIVDEKNLRRDDIVIGLNRDYEMVLGCWGGHVDGKIYIKYDNEFIDDEVFDVDEIRIIGRGIGNFRSFD